MKKLYRVRLLVSGNAPPVDDGALLVHGEQIVAVGQFKQLAAEHVDACVTDFGEAIMAPTLVNAHTHLDLTDFPLWAQRVGETKEPDNFVDWILQLIRVKKKCSGVDFKQTVTHGVSQSIAAGTGLIGDILAYHPAVDTYSETPLAGRVFLETLGQNPEMIPKVYAKLVQLLSQKDYGEVVKGVSPHSPYTVNADYMQQLYQHCRQQRIFCSTHFAESPDEVEFVAASQGPLVEKFYAAVGWQSFVPEASGLRPLAYLEQQGGLFPQNLLVHGVQVNQEEIDVLASKRMAIALCPRSNSRLNVGKAPVGQMLDSGVRLALGTDSRASCDSLSIWDEMAFAHSWFEGELDAPSLFYLATLSGADVLGMADSYGSLEAGKVASFQILQPKSTVAQAEVFDYFVGPGCGHDIAHVFIKGKEQVKQ